MKNVRPSPYLVPGKLKEVRNGMSRNEEFAQGDRKEGLSEQDREILEYAKNLKKTPYLRSDEMMDQFGIPPAVFYQRLNRIIDDPNALAHDPHTVKRYQAIRNRGMQNSQQ